MPPISGNTFGTLFTVTACGESHGEGYLCIVDGCPPGMALSEADIQPDLDRRRPGTSRHVTQRNEPDAVEILSGVYEGLTTGTPICLLIRNTDQRSKDYGNILQTFRPGHADYTYWHKYGIRDPRGGGRSSARLTAPMVGAMSRGVMRPWVMSWAEIPMSATNFSSSAFSLSSETIWANERARNPTSSVPPSGRSTSTASRTSAGVGAKTRRTRARSSSSERLGVFCGIPAA